MEEKEVLIICANTCRASATSERRIDGSIAIRSGLPEYDSCTPHVTQDTYYYLYEGMVLTGLGHQVYIHKYLGQP